MPLATIIADGLRPAAFGFSPDGEIWGRRAAFCPGFHLVWAPSGRGKSTLIRELSGLSRACGGQVLLEGFPEGLRPFSVLDQGLACLPSLTCRENLLLGIPGQEEDAGRTEDLAGRLGIGGLLGVPCSRVSRGELQRLLALRVLLQDSAWILLDEPFAHLDAGAAATLMGLFRAEAERGRSVLMTALDPWPDGRLGGVRQWRLQ